MKYRGRKKKYPKRSRLVRYLLRALPFILIILIGTGYRLIRGTAADRPALSPSGDGLLTIDFIDVGQGNAALIEAPDGEFMLIDAGPPESADKLLSWMDSRGVRDIRYAVFSHPHADHIGGGDEVILTYNVRTVLMTDAEFDIPSFYRLGKAILAKGCEVISPAPGDRFEFGGAEFTILAPDRTDYENLNDVSIVLRLKYGETSAMFTGDAEEACENAVLAGFKASELRSDILQVGHHGSFTSSTARFLQAVMPEYAVISCARDNDYGHPHAITLRKLGDIGASVVRTDEKGTITFVSDGRNFKLSSDR